jgi:hypothetical protein
MRRLVRIALLLVGVGGCSEILGLNRPHRPDDGGPGGAGSSLGGAGQAGSEAGARDSGAGGARAGNGGRGGDTGNGGGDSGNESGGDGGQNHGAAGASAGGDSGDGGVAGSNEGGVSGAGDIGPVLGAPCDQSHDYSCTALEPNLLLICREGTWDVSQACINDERCDPERRECRPLDLICRGRVEAYCSGSYELIDCGSDPFEPESFECPFGCDAGRCLPGSGDELVVHTERVQSGSVQLWDEPIPVCFHDEGGDATLVEVIRDEVERTWGFLLNVEFKGWSECSGDEATRRVELAFLDDCELRLAGSVPAGAPPAGEARTVEFCRTYYDASGELEELHEHEALLRFLARHQFGHVLGSRDNDATLTPVVMQRGVRESDAGDVQLTIYDIETYRFDYGQKPTGSLVIDDGTCLSPDASGFRSLPCSDQGSGYFDLVGAEVTSLREAAPGCLSVPPGEDALVSLDACGDPSGATELELTHVRWGTPDLCIAPERGELGSPLVAGPCAPAGDPAQAWWFEILASDAQKLIARLRFAATGDCVGLLEPAQFGALPKLEACNDTLETRHLFALWVNGMISHAESGLCPQWDMPGGVLYLDRDARCSYDTYWISGALETPDGRLLSFTNDDGVEELRAVSPASGALPLPSQIFGFTF